MPVIYLLFTCYKESYDPERSYLNEFGLALINCFRGPFTHVSICYPEVDKELSAIKQVSIQNTKNNIGDQFVRYICTLNLSGQCFVKLNITQTQQMRLDSIISKLSHIKFDFLGMLGVTNVELPLDINKKLWYCVNLTGFLLQEIGVLDKNIRIHDLSVTSFYLVVRKIENCIQETRDPIFGDCISTPDELYERYQGYNLQTKGQILPI